MEKCFVESAKQPRTLLEADYLLCVTDVSRLGAFRFKQDEGTCSIKLALSQVELFGLRLNEARNNIREVGVAVAVAVWREVAEGFGSNKKRARSYVQCF